jgi:hypothetical protein
MYKSLRVKIYIVFFKADFHGRKTVKTLVLVKVGEVQIQKRQPD